MRRKAIYADQTDCALWPWRDVSDRAQGSLAELGRSALAVPLGGRWRHPPTGRAAARSLAGSHESPVLSEPAFARNHDRVFGPMVFRLQADAPVDARCRDGPPRL